MSVETYGQGSNALAVLLFGAAFLLGSCAKDAPTALSPNPYAACVDLDTPVDAALAGCRELLARSDTPDVQRTTAHNRLGFDHLAHGRYAAALTEFDRSLALTPDFAGTYLGRGWARLSLYRPEQAVLDFNRSIELSPTLRSAYEGRGIARLALENCRGAIADFDLFLTETPRSTRALRNRGDCHLDVGNLSAALADYNAVIEIVEVAQPDLFLTRAKILSAMGRSSNPVQDWIADLARKDAKQTRAWQRHMTSQEGVYLGPIDGKLTPETRRALAACAADEACRTLRPTRN